MGDQSPLWKTDSRLDWDRVTHMTPFFRPGFCKLFRRRSDVFFWRIKASHHQETTQLIPNINSTETRASLITVSPRTESSSSSSSQRRSRRSCTFRRHPPPPSDSPRAQEQRPSNVQGVGASMTLNRRSPFLWFFGNPWAFSGVFPRNWTQKKL